MNTSLYTQANTVFEDNSNRSAFGLIMATSGRVLLMRKNDMQSSEHGKFELPGGGLDNYESFNDGALREIREETGYSAAFALPVTGLQHDGKRGTTELMIFMAPATVEFTPSIAKNPVTGKLEHSGHAWLELEQIIRRDDIHTKQQACLRQNMGAVQKATAMLLNLATARIQNFDIDL